MSVASADEPVGDERLYGLEGWETFLGNFDEVVAKAIDDGHVFVDEGEDALANRIAWPLKVLVFRRVRIDEKDVKLAAKVAIEYVLDLLDAEYGNPENDKTEPTAKMAEAALVFARAIASEYTPWAYEATGEIIKVSREEARKMVEGEK